MTEEARVVLVELVPPLELLLEPLSGDLHPPTRASVSNTDVRKKNLMGFF